MATRKLSFQYVLKQNKNEDSTAFGKYFAEAYSPSETLSLKGLCERVAMDQSLFTPEIARGVIDKLTTDMCELLQSATSVKWDGLGTFRPTVESQGAASPEDYNINTDVVGIHIRFVPVNDKGEELTSRKFAQQLVFVKYGEKVTQKVTKPSGKKGYKGYIEPSASISAQSKLPFLSKVDGAAPASPISLAVAGGTVLLFSGFEDGITYTLKRGDAIATAVSMGSATAAGGLTINSTAAEADAGQKDLYIAWTKKGKSHYMLLGKSIVA